MEENKPNQFVILPKKDTLLQKYEILIYVCIRRYMDAKTMEAYPSIECVMRESGCSKPTVNAAIKTIEEKGYFKRIPKKLSKSKVKGRGYVYVFNNEKHFEPFSYEFLDNSKLSKSEKLQILCTQQYMILDDATQQGKVSYSDRELSEKTGLDYRTIRRNNESLIDKGYANQITLQTKDPVTGLINRETIYHLNKIGQAIVFALRNHEQRLTKHDNQIESLEERVQKLEEVAKSKDKDNELLLRENSKLREEIRLLKQSRDAIILDMPLNNQEGTGD